jgi:hypothetical protein
VRNQAAFQQRYGSGKTIAGAYGPNNLANEGERIELSDRTGLVIHDFAYGSTPPWPTAPDGAGYSLRLTAPASRPDHALSTNWRAGITGVVAAHGGITNAEGDQDGDGRQLMECA